MAERDFESEFWEIAVHEVSREPEVREAVRWLMTETVTLESMPEFDHYDTYSNMHQRYGITEEQLFQAYEIREQEEEYIKNKLYGEA